MTKEIKKQIEFLQSIYMLLYQSEENRVNVMCRINEELERLKNYENK
jgi:hypothetical protein